MRLLAPVKMKRGYNARRVELGAALPLVTGWPTDFIIHT